MHSDFFFILILGYVSTDFRKAGGERERETWTDCLLYMPQPGIEPTTEICALTGN